MTSLAQQSLPSPATAVPTEGERKYAGFWTAAWRRFRRNKLAIFGLVYVVLIILVAIFAPFVTNYTIDKIDPQSALQGPSLQHFFGTDYLGRDIYTRMIYGARPMLIVGLFTQIIALIIGTTLGLLAGYMGGVVDWIITRLIDLFSALPWYLIVLYLVMVLSPSMRNLIIALSITSWVASCRIVRGLTLSIREQDYIEAANALGIQSWRIVGFHVLPQAAPLLIWAFAAGVPAAVFAEASMSFLGMGIRPPDPSWGQMLAESGQYFAYWPHMLFFPAIFIILSVLAFQGLADGLRQAVAVNVNI
jgi:ABC-type dipeptide/oligopeptide/nickel transport system permease subunit